MASPQPTFTGPSPSAVPCCNGIVGSESKSGTVVDILEQPPRNELPPPSSSSSLALPDDEDDTTPMTVLATSSSSSQEGAKKPSVYEILMKAQQERQQQQQKSPEGHYSHVSAVHRPVQPFHPPAPSSSPSSFLRKTNNNNKEQDFNLGKLTRQSLPYFVPWHPTAGPDALPPNYNWISESCAGKAAIGIFGGGCMGLLWGVFLGAMSDTSPPLTMVGGREIPQAPLREHFRTTLRATGEKSLYWCRQFAFITGVFGGSECLVEKARGTKDVWNSAIGGCVTGAAMQARSGPQSALIGCGGFAAFSLVADTVMESLGYDH